MIIDFSRPPNPKEREQLSRRLHRLYDMEDSYWAATTNLAVLAQQQGTVAHIRIRDAFVYRNEPAPIDASDRRLPAREYQPPATRIKTPRGAALRLMLIALFEAQTRPRPGGYTDNPRPLAAEGDDIGWTDLLATDAKAAGAGRTRMSVQTKKDRQLSNALDSLAAEELIDLPHVADRRHKQRGFLLMREHGRRRTGPNERYTVPKKTEAFFDLPVTVFTRGWVHVLEDTELAFLLMLAYRHRNEPDGFRITSDTRLLHMGIGRDAYEAHMLFNQIDIASVTVDPSRHPNGTVDDISRGNPAIPHTFRFLPDGLGTDALRTVTAEIDRQLAR